MERVPVQRLLPDAAATERLGEDMAMALRAGDIVLLRGDLGTGKTTLARALIRAMGCDPSLEVPSPTFTLVQSYEARVAIRHFDLYRLSSGDELEELGFEEALGEAAVLVEWPERAEGAFPHDAVTVDLMHSGDGRLATISGQGARFDRIRRSIAMRDFLGHVGWGEARRTYLTGDASARSYETVIVPGEPVRILMNSPRLVLGPPVRGGKAYAEIAHTAQTAAAFVGVGGALGKRGVTVPTVFASDLDQGFLLIEHLGDGSFLDERGAPMGERYAAAAELLAFMHGQRWTDAMPVAGHAQHVLPPFDRDAMMIEVELLLEWYLPNATGKAPSAALRAEFRRLWTETLDRLDGVETSILLRDYHSPNIVWRDERTGFDRLGVLDFQDAMRGPTAYDVASLAMDARVDIPPEIEAAAVTAYCEARAAQGAFDREAFGFAYAVMAAQRNSKILGIFVRLDRRDGKPNYLKLLPRIRGYLARALSHPGLTAMRRFYAGQGFIDETGI